MTFPNPFEKPLPKPEDMDDEKNKELVRAFLGEEGLQRYGNLFKGNRKPKQKTTHAELLERARVVIAQKERLLKESLQNQVEQILDQQYTAHLDSLAAIKFLETNERGELGFFDMSNAFCRVPSKEQIRDHFLSIPHIAQKMNQGFTRLLIVPFGASLTFFKERTAEVLRTQKAAGKLFDREGRPVVLDKESPVFLDVADDADFSGELMYYPKQFERKNHGGKTKESLFFLDITNNPDLFGYHILLIQEDPTIPPYDNGVTKGGRPAFELGVWNPSEALELFETNSAYQNEHGLTPEDWLTLFSIHAYEKNKVIGDWDTDDFELELTDGQHFLIGVYLNHSDKILEASWDRNQGKLRVTQANTNPRFVSEYELTGVISAIG